MRHWTNDEHMMIACCNDGTRPVIFKIERLDYKVLHVDADIATIEKIVETLKNIDGILGVTYRADKKFTEIYMDRNHEVSDEKIFTAVQFAGIFDARID